MFGKKKGEPEQLENKFHGEALARHNGESTRKNIELANANARSAELELVLRNSSHFKVPGPARLSAPELQGFHSVRELAGILKKTDSEVTRALLAEGQIELVRPRGQTIEDRIAALTEPRIPADIAKRVLLRAS